MSRVIRIGAATVVLGLCLSLALPVSSAGAAAGTSTSRHSSRLIYTHRFIGTPLLSARLVGHSATRRTVAPEVTKDPLSRILKPGV